MFVIFKVLFFNIAMLIICEKVEKLKLFKMFQQKFVENVLKKFNVLKSIFL